MATASFIEPLRQENIDLATHLRDALELTSLPSFRQLTPDELRPLTKRARALSAALGAAIHDPGAALTVDGSDADQATRGCVHHGNVHDSAVVDVVDDAVDEFEIEHGAPAGAERLAGRTPCTGPIVYPNLERRSSARAAAPPFRDVLGESSAAGGAALGKPDETPTFRNLTAGKAPKVAPLLDGGLLPKLVHEPRRAPVFTLRPDTRLDDAIGAVATSLTQLCGLIAADGTVKFKARNYVALVSVSARMLSVLEAVAADVAGGAR